MELRLVSFLLNEYVMLCYVSIALRHTCHSRFLKVFPSIAICPLLRLISWNLTTECLAVRGGGSVGECGRLSQPSWLLGAL